LPRPRSRARVTAEKGEAGIRITTSALSLVAEGLTGIDAAAFTEVAKEAESKCPVSNALPRFDEGDARDDG